MSALVVSAPVVSAPVVRALRAIALGWVLHAAACAPPGDFALVHHRANGCDLDAAENSPSGVRCVTRECFAGTAPCALEVDVRVLRVTGGSLGGDLELVVMHDGTSARTAACPSEITFPGGAPIAPEILDACRLINARGEPTSDPIPTLDRLLDLLGTPVTMFLELKTESDPALRHALVAGALDRLSPAARARTVITSFDVAALGEVKRLAPDLRTACFAPSGGSGAQVGTLLRGAVLDDLDRCARQGHDLLFVPPQHLDGAVLVRAARAGRIVGVFGADTADGYDVVQRFAHGVGIVYADHPRMYR
ncbi:MAG: hypothetical protein IT384_02880 [Deltaproteobacteria bacterium]|nr:hypothetical protein [Deltaproteobacteria bacterium]